jgi:hypothetical protein
MTKEIQRKIITRTECALAIDFDTQIKRHLQVSAGYGLLVY